MQPFEEAVRTGDAAAVRVLLTKQPELRAAIDRPAFDTAPAIVFSRHDRAMVDTLLDATDDVASRSAAVLHGFRQQGRADGVAATCRGESRVTKIIMMLFGALLAVSCTSPAVSKAVGTGADGATPIVVRTSESAVVVENHAGRPLLNVRITLTAPDLAMPFILVVPTLEIGATSEQPLTGFRSEDGTMLDPSAVHPTQVAITARDTLAKSYDVTVPWNR